VGGDEEWRSVETADELGVLIGSLRKVCPFHPRGPNPRGSHVPPKVCPTRATACEFRPVRFARCPPGLLCPPTPL
jgi:hypothetical protein